MKRIIEHILFSFVLICLFQSCIPEALEVKNIPKADEQWVVSSLLDGSGSVKLALTKSFGALDAGSNSSPATVVRQVLVPDAEVSIEYYGRKVPFASDFQGFYVSDEIDQIFSADYKLVVHDPKTGKTATSVTRLNPTVYFSSLKTTLEPNSIDTFMRVEYEFRDERGPNWYAINVQKYERDLFASFTENQPYTHLIPHNEEKDGEIIEDDFVAIFNGFYDPGDSVLVSLSNISKEYYDYLEIKGNRRLSVNFLTEPFNFPTNIEGGYGFFNLHFVNSEIKVLR